MPSGSPAVTASILKPWHVSVLQSPFLINQLCDPFLHASSSTNSSLKALNGMNLWMQTGNGLLKHTKGNSMDSLGSATAKTHYWPSCPHPCPQLSQGKPWAGDAASSFPHSPFCAEDTWEPQLSTAAWQDPNCDTSYQKADVGWERKFKSPLTSEFNYGKHSVCSLLRTRTFLCQMIALTPSPEPSQGEWGWAAQGQL